MNHRRTLPRVLFLVLPLLLLCTTAHADTGVLDSVLDKYKAATDAWSTKFLTYGTALFWILAGIEIVWVAIGLVIRHADIQEWVSDLVRWILITGFFWALLTNGTTWLPAIINSFRQAGDGAQQAYDGSLPGGLSPSTLLDLCLNVAAKVCDAASSWNPASMVFVGLFGIAILLGGAYIAMVQVCALVEMYIVVAIGMLLLGFGGSRWTRDYSAKIMTYAVSVGVKLMIIQLLIGIGLSFLNDFVTAYTSFSVENVSPIIVALIVLCGLVKAIPNLAQSIISGASIGHGGGFGTAMGLASQATRAATIATAAAMGGTGAVLGAAQLAAAQGGGGGGSAAGSSGGSGMGLGASIMKGVNFGGRMAGNMVKAAGKDISDGLKGERKPFTNMGQRMASNMSNASVTMKAATADKPKST